MGKVAIGTIIAIVTIPLKEVDALPTAHFGMPQATSRDSQRVDLLRLLSRLCIFCNFGAKFST